MTLEMTDASWYDAIYRKKKYDDERLGNARKLLSSMRILFLFPLVSLGKLGEFGS